MHQPDEREQAAVSCSADEHEDKDGDVVMAEKDVEQLIASLQAARHASSEWETLEGPSSIFMLLFGHQVKHPCCCQGLRLCGNRICRVMCALKSRMQAFHVSVPLQGSLVHC